MLHIESRFLRGLTAGILAGIPTFIFNWLSFSLNYSEARWSDFLGVLVFGRTPSGTGETVFSVFAVYIYLGFLGIIFAWLINRTSGHNFLLKSIYFSWLIWFFSFSVMHLFRVPEFASMSFQTVLTNFTGALIWGITLSFLLRWFDRKTKTDT